MNAATSLPHPPALHLLVSFLVLPLTFACFMLLPPMLGLWQGYLLSFIIYWSFCLWHGLVLKGKSVQQFYRFPPLNKQNALLSLLCFIPAAGAFAVSFLPKISVLDPVVVMLVLTVAVLNGFLEEFYWRTAFISRFKQQLYFAFLVPACLFGLWHISVGVAPGVLYQGGMSALVGGAFFMGLLWGYTAYKQQRVLVPTLAHILTNFFAFTGLVLDNFISW